MLDPFGPIYTTNKERGEKQRRERKRGEKQRREREEEEEKETGDRAHTVQNSAVWNVPRKTVMAGAAGGSHAPLITVITRIVLVPPGLWS